MGGKKRKLRSFCESVFVGSATFAQTEGRAIFIMKVENHEDSWMIL